MQHTNANTLLQHHIGVSQLQILLVHTLGHVLDDVVDLAVVKPKSIARHLVPALEPRYVTIVFLWF